METVTLIIGLVKNGDSILLRKKPVGSKPYMETWYSFGTEFVPKQDPAQTFIEYLKNYVGITVRMTKQLPEATEVKADRAGVVKQYEYLNFEFEYVSGEPELPEDLVKVEFVPIDQLQRLDIVPPSVKMFKQLGYLK